MKQPRSITRLIKFSLFILSLLAGCSSPIRPLNGSPYTPPRAAPELNLETTSGEPFTLSEFSGDIVLVYFGYTFCPDICPTTLADVKLIFEKLGERAEQVHMIMVTVDPDRDSPEVLRTYLQRFDPRFLGLRGEGEELEAVMSSYGVFAQKEASDDAERYLVSHTARLFLIDKQGNLRTNYSFGTAREEILADLELLLDEEPQS